ncbi:hypothetical protein SBBP2_1090004 [Burkholderiales bacterium]|nr:hypothetical protein SBBP2_1090004 [Burkholderiales bacterium]
MKLPKPEVGPKLTWKQVEELTDLAGPDGRKYHGELPATWDNAEFVSNNLGNIDPAPGFPDGYAQNVALKAAIAKAFVEIKKINLNDPNGPLWLLAWRMYPNADHPMWKDDSGPQCGCNCGCFVPR